MPFQHASPRILKAMKHIEQHLGLMVASGAGDRDAVRLLERRIERIETRLSLSDS